MVDFAVLPPEVNSGRMYAGPGSAAMLAAASSWSGLAVELGSAARGYRAVISELAGQWSGPAAESMAAAAAPYAAWLDAAAVRAEQVAARIGAAVSAFEEAFAAVVPPPLIAANRGRLAALVASNVFGQNTAAIAEVEAQYAVMWGQDVAAMYGYAARSAVAVAVAPFAGPPTATNPAGGGAHTQLSQLLTAMPQALHEIASPAALAAASPLQSIDPLPTPLQLLGYFYIIPRSIVPFNDALKTVLYGMLQYSRNLNIASDLAAARLGAQTAGPVSAESMSRTVPTQPVAVRLGSAVTVGKLTAPPSWAQVAPEVRVAAAALPTTSPAAAPAVVADLPTGVFADMGLASLAGRALAGSAPRSHPAAAMNGHAQGRLERLVAELAGTHEVQHWHTDPSRLDSLLEELAQQPGVHAVHVNDDGTQIKSPPQPS